MVSVKPGDVIYLDFLGKLAKDKSVFSTTLKEEAQKAGLDPERAYKPLLIVAGKGQLPKGLDDAVIGAEVGQKKHIAISVDKAFGPRDPAKIRLIPVGEFRKRDADPFPGMPVEIDGNITGIVKSVEGGRVRVDFNDPLAGEDLEYDFTVVKCATDAASKLSLLLDGIVGLHDPAFDSSTGIAKIKVATSVRKDVDYMSNKVAFVSMALQYVEGLKKVIFEEEWAVTEKPAA